MNETDSSFSNLEHPSLAESLTVGRHTLRGWLVPKQGSHFTDVRVWNGGRMHAAVFGYPRPDLTAHFKSEERPLLAGWQAQVVFFPGKNLLTFEALAISGTWQPFLRVELSGQSADDGMPVAPPSEPLHWYEYVRALELALRKPMAIDALAQSLVFERRLIMPSPPFRGYFDEPAALTPIAHGRIAVGGYLLHDTSPIHRILATTDLLLWQSVESGRSRPDVGAHFPENPRAATSGFFGLIDAPSQLPAPLALRLYAELPDGSVHLCGAQRTLIIPPAAVDRSATSTGRPDFEATRRQWDDALRRNGIAWHGQAELTEAIKRLAAEFAERFARSMSVAKHHRPGVPASLTKVTLCTHNLNLEGAPFFLLDLARALIAEGANLTLLSPADGPMSPRFTVLGVKVAIEPLDTLMSANSEQDVQAALTTLAGKPAFTEASLVIANTFAAFWGVQAARIAGKPSLFYVHESVRPAHFFRERLSAELVSKIEEAFTLADCVSYTATSTRDCHQAYARPDNQHITPGWIDIAALDSWRAAHPRSEIRARFTLRDDELLVSNIGTVSDRKGQHMFVRAVELLCRHHPQLAARTRFIMLGGRDTTFDRLLADLLAQAARPNLIVVPETSDYLPYFHAADLFVCSSFEESSPRVVLEAMAMGTPILCSAVNGVTEQVRQGVEAELVPAGDSAALARGMVKLLMSAEVRHTHASAARTRVKELFDAEIQLPRHVALARAVAGGHF